MLTLAICQDSPQARTARQRYFAPHIQHLRNCMQNIRLAAKSKGASFPSQFVPNWSLSSQTGIRLGKLTRQANALTQCYFAVIVIATQLCSFTEGLTGL
jgi:hypothetical protein